MSQRHKAAIMISNGAVNPSGIAHAIVQACAEAYQEKCGTLSMCRDPAIRLMVHQLGYLMGFPDTEMHAKERDGTDWHDWREACRSHMTIDAN